MQPNQYPAYLAKELAFPDGVKRGSRGMSARRVQEWLSHHGRQTGVDGDFGPATEVALQSFQAANNLSASGKLDRQTWNGLVAPLTAALADTVLPAGTGVDLACLTFARQHLKQHPHELGGDNCGPWVRSYMNGNEGPEWYWCAGFVSLIIAQAALQLDMLKPVPGSVSCDTLAAQARTAGRLIPGASVRNGSADGVLGKCFVFLVRRTSTDWTHTGVGFNLVGDTFSTIEGNTNDDGSRNGYEVCQRVRSIADKDFISLA